VLILEYGSNAQSLGKIGKTLIFIYFNMINVTEYVVLGTNNMALVDTCEARRLLLWIEVSANPASLFRAFASNGY
jgi:hypothetical protein